jgi:hypothetical protein
MGGNDANQMKGKTMETLMMISMLGLLMILFMLPFLLLKSFVQWLIKPSPVVEIDVKSVRGQLPGALFGVLVGMVLMSWLV